MKRDMKGLFAEKIVGFRLPRYRELPDMGLYLEQVTKYINGFIIPLGYAEITTSMISNYVKKGVIAAPVKKQYYAEQIACLFFVSIAKSILTMEHITMLFDMYQGVYTPEVSYNYFCEEFENMLLRVSGLGEAPAEVGGSVTDVKIMLRSIIFAASHIIFVNHCFEATKDNK